MSEYREYPHDKPLNFDVRTGTLSLRDQTQTAILLERIEQLNELQKKFDKNFQDESITDIHGSLKVEIEISILKTLLEYGTIQLDEFNDNYDIRKELREIVSFAVLFRGVVQKIVEDFTD